MNDPVRLQVGGKNHVLKTITQTLAYCSNEYGKVWELRELINQGGFTPPALIFVQSKERAQALFKQLSGLTTQLRIECIHGDKDTGERESLIQRFHNGELWALISTDLLVIYYIY
jgi:ATP-dependent RNA helicase DDX52/ROK1